MRKFCRVGLSLGFVVSALSGVTGCGEEADDEDESSVCPRADDSDGGYSDANSESSSVEAAASFAADKVSGISDASFEALCAQTQVVAGTNYRIGLDLGGETWLVVVYEDLDGNLELSDSEMIE